GKEPAAYLADRRPPPAGGEHRTGAGRTRHAHAASEERIQEKPRGGGVAGADRQRSPAFPPHLPLRGGFRTSGGLRQRGQLVALPRRRPGKGDGGAPRPGGGQGAHPATASHRERAIGFARRGQVVRAEEGKKPRLLATIGDKDELGGYVKINDWNQYHIIARGNQMIHILNGHVMSVFIDDDPTKFRKNGLIGIQIEGTGKVSFRNLWIKPASPL